MSTTLILRDQYGIHPDDQKFVEDKLREIAEHFDQFRLLEMSALERVWLIGQGLIEIKGKVFEGQWENFCRNHFRNLTQRTIQHWMQLAAFRPALLKEFRPGLGDGVSSTAATTYEEPETKRASSTKSTTYTEPRDLPGVAAALKVIQGWMRKHREGKRSTSNKSSPREYCPHCGQFLSKRVKVWIKTHGH